MLSARTLTLVSTLSLILAIVFHIADAHLVTPPARRDVSAPHRMLKQRAPALLALPESDSPAGQRTGASDAGSTLNPNPTNTSPQSTIGGRPSQPVVQSATGAEPPAGTAGTSGDGGLLPGAGGVVSGIIGGAPQSSLNISTIVFPTSSTTLTSSSSLATSTSSTLPTTQSTVSDSQSTVTPSQVTVTSSETQVPTESANVSEGSHVTKLQRNTIITLIAIGASIGAAGLIWTIIRKWKFRPSSSFEDRMQPIDWQPTMGGGRETTERLGRSGSVASHGSFTSGNNNHDHLVADLPPHDFTAGAAHLAPVGGYADLHRGPSPQPDLHAGPNYRSPSPYHYEPQNPHMQQGPYYNTGGGYQGGYDNRGY